MTVYSDQYFSGGRTGFGYTDYDRDKQPMVPTFHEYLDRLARYGKSTGKLLDVGAATGFFLDLARRRGWQVCGVEPSDYAASLARSKDIDVRTGTLDHCGFPAESFDAISMWDVIEHMPDPRCSFSSVVSLLKPGGLVAINTPDSSSLMARMLRSKWHLVVPPEHLNLFSRRSLKCLVESLGLEVLEVTSIGKTFTMQYILMTLAHWLKSDLFGAATKALRGSRAAEWRLSINLRDNVFMVARKR